MDSEFLKALPALGVGGVLAAMMFWFYQKAESRNAASIKEMSEKHQDQLIEHNTFLRDLMVTTNNVIRENTASNTRLITVIDGLQIANAQMMALFRRNKDDNTDVRR